MEGGERADAVHSRMWQLDGIIKRSRGDVHSLVGLLSARMVMQGARELYHCSGVPTEATWKFGVS